MGYQITVHYIEEGNILVIDRQIMVYNLCDNLYKQDHQIWNMVQDNMFNMIL